MPNDQKIDYLELPASDFDATQAFYQKVFNWAFTDYGPEYRAFTEGKIDGGFYKSEKCSSTANGSVLVVLYADNLAQTQQRIIDSGGRIIAETFTFPGGRRFHFADPNGNELAVWSDK